MFNQQIGNKGALRTPTKANFVDEGMASKTISSHSNPQNFFP